MTDTVERAGAKLLPAAQLDVLIGALRKGGYRVVAPVLQQRALCFLPVESAAEVAVGWTDQQQPGSYEISRDGKSSSSDGQVFGLRCGPRGAKEWLYPPALRLWSAERKGKEFRVSDDDTSVDQIAIVGLRPCDLAAIRVQDRVFLEGPYADPHYRRRRERTLLVVANCTRSGETCFCSSLGTGPQATEGFDVALTEVQRDGSHVFVLVPGSPEGQTVLDALGGTPAQERDLTAASESTRGAASEQKRAIDPDGLKEALQERIEHDEWDAVSRRCLACGNCTLVCPTCFCSTVEDVTDLSGRHAERIRKWDSCFTRDFSYIYGGQIRRSIQSRYRQWLTHKLAHWQDQFGVLGCVGCGRCITWCPVGIDLTEEVRALRERGQ
jgi:ferredoxin